MIKAVIFDMDGLMFDTEKLWEDAFLNVGKKFNLNLSADFHRKTIGTNYKSIEKVFKKNFGCDFPFDNFIVECRKYMDNIIKKDGLKIKKGLLELLNYLKENKYLIAIASSGRRKTIEWYLKCSKIDKNIFNTITCGDDVLNGKPHPDIFIKTCATLKVNPANTLVLEDSNNGIKAAYNSKCTAVLIPDLDIIKEDTLKMANYKFDSLLDVIDLLKSR